MVNRLQAIIRDIRAREVTRHRRHTCASNSRLLVARTLAKEVLHLLDSTLGPRHLPPLLLDIPLDFIPAVRDRPRP
jgi:hypothetical protein